MQKNFEGIFDEITNQQSKHSKSIKFLLNILFPVIIAILGIISKDLYEFSKVFCVGSWIVLILVYCFVWYYAQPSYSDVFDLLNLKRKDENTIASLNNEMNSLKLHGYDLYIKNMLSFVLRQMSIGYIKSFRNSSVDASIFEEMISEITSPLYFYGDKLLRGCPR